MARKKNAGRRISLDEILDAGEVKEELAETRNSNSDASVSPELSAGDVDARWTEAGSIGDEGAGGSTPTPDQDVVDEIGKAIGVTYQESEPLRVGRKELERDKHRWELDPASAEDYRDRARESAGPSVPVRTMRHEHRHRR